METRSKKRAVHRIARLRESAKFTNKMAKQHLANSTRILNDIVFNSKKPGTRGRQRRFGSLLQWFRRETCLAQSYGDQTKRYVEEVQQLLLRVTPQQK